MYNRVRGSLTEPVTETSYTSAAWWDSSPQSKVRYKRHYKQIADQYEKYGDGVWHYKPVCMERVDEEEVVGPYGPFVNLGCCDSDVTHNVGGDSCPPQSYVGEYQLSIPAKAYARLGGRVEARLPSLRPDFDLFVFLVELKDLKELIHLFQLKGNTILEKAADKNLSLHFGLFPLIEDAKEILKSAKRLMSKLDRLRQGEGKVHDLKTSFHQAEPDLLDDQVWSTWRPYGCVGTCPNGYPASSCVVYETLSYKCSATVKYRYKLPPIDDLFDELASLLTAWGIMPNLESYWELVPFSFVVDWFLNTDRIFSQFSPLDKNEIKTEIIDCCVASYSVQERRVAFNRMCAGLNGESPKGYALKRAIKYERVVGGKAWEMLSGPWFKIPGFMQLHLGASLLIQMWRKKA